MTYVHIVLAPSGWVATKARYSSKETAKSWSSFVKKAWRGLPIRLIEITQKNIDKYDLNRNHEATKEST